MQAYSFENDSIEIILFPAGRALATDFFISHQHLLAPLELEMNVLINDQACSIVAGEALLVASNSSHRFTENAKLPDRIFIGFKELKNTSFNVKKIKFPEKIRQLALSALDKKTVEREGLMQELASLVISSEALK